MLIVHIAGISLSPKTGMGRIALHWKKAIEDAGYEFLHIGKEEVAEKYHGLLWGVQVRKYLKTKGIKPDVWLVHEPIAGFFTGSTTPVIMFSHGLEERSWEVAKEFGLLDRTFKSMLLPRRLRFWSNRKGIREANMLLVSNKTDQEHIMDRYGRSDTITKVFLNGCSLAEENIQNPTKLHYLFNGTWIKRKGIEILIQAFDFLWQQGYTDWELTIAGTVFPGDIVLTSIPAYLHRSIRVIPEFAEQDELNLYQNADVFLFPSYFEGQSLALNQALASGLCCIASDNCGQLDVIQNGVNGLLFETGSVHALVAQIQLVRDDRKLLKSLSARAKEQQQQITWENARAQFIKHLSTILTNHPAKNQLLS